ncbi:hypothetical protein PTTG_09853 [Puccinia triticina 1-1 BBBD Race 1]|uniref:Uncharacterized protein n=2 Tax=Puccinia triticina TaxID=208348 RepID=A0A0C4F9H3_PUCT1|nr:uncharacterized protein PtA15_12A226 [Puccinia triticina]OAV88924.1 hypothetical protein PTTG_09853 [Puccinia triticina 1-1 BBBD Race 1]WAQ90239.1 hypothetical protein PtA15_12A226 [Puccinia triticina]WAR61545.1 hypothetical protein PtB15_12B235 [Puccinia triticina]
MKLILAPVLLAALSPLVAAAPALLAAEAAAIPTAKYLPGNRSGTFVKAPGDFGAQAGQAVDSEAKVAAIILAQAAAVHSATA